MPKCRICRQPAIQRFGLTYACSVEHAIEIANLAKQKAEEKRRKAFRAETREKRAKIKTLETLCAETQKDVNRYVMAKARANGDSCISCGSPNITDAGHFIHAGSKYRTSRLRFDLRIINPQCAKCNRFSGGGNHGAYREGLLAKYGQGRLDSIEDLKRQADSGELLPLTKEEVIEIGRKHRAMTREIGKTNG